MLPLKDCEVSGKFPVFTVLIILANVWVFFLELTTPNPDYFITTYALIPATVNFYNPVTLMPFLTSQFVHGGLIHIASNMLFLWVFGNNVEARLGFLFPIFYLLAGVAGNLSQFFFIQNSTIAMLGASGAIAGVLGAYFAMFPTHKIKTLLFIFIFITIVELPASLLLFYWLIIQLFSSAVAVSSSAEANMGGVAYFAHIGGFALGWLTGKAILFSAPANTPVGKA